MAVVVRAAVAAALGFASASSANAALMNFEIAAGTGDPSDFFSLFLTGSFDTDAVVRTTPNNGVVKSVSTVDFNIKDAALVLI